MSTAADGWAGMSPAEDALHDTNGAVMTPTNTTRSTVATGSEILSPPTDRLPSGMSTPMPAPADGRAGMLPAENAFHDVDDAMMISNHSNILEGALGRARWVMDAVSPVAEVRRNVLFGDP